MVLRGYRQVLADRCLYHVADSLMNFTNRSECMHPFRSTVAVGMFLWKWQNTTAGPIIINISNLKFLKTWIYFFPILRRYLNVMLQCSSVSSPDFIFCSTNFDDLSLNLIFPLLWNKWNLNCTFHSLFVIFVSLPLVTAGLKLKEMKQNSLLKGLCAVLLILLDVHMLV